MTNTLDSTLSLMCDSEKVFTRLVATAFMDSTSMIKVVIAFSGLCVMRMIRFLSTNKEYLTSYDLKRVGVSLLRFLMTFLS